MIKLLIQPIYLWLYWHMQLLEVNPGAAAHPQLHRELEPRSKTPHLATKINPSSWLVALLVNSGKQLLLVDVMLVPVPIIVLGGMHAHKFFPHNPNQSGK